MATVLLPNTFYLFSSGNVCLAKQTNLGNKIFFGVSKALIAHCEQIHVSKIITGSRGVARVCEYHIDKKKKFWRHGNQSPRLEFAEVIFGGTSDSRKYVCVRRLMKSIKWQKASRSRRGPIATTLASSWVVESFTCDHGYPGFSLQFDIRVSYVICCRHNHLQNNPKHYKGISGFSDGQMSEGRRVAVWNKARAWWDARGHQVSEGKQNDP